MTMTSRFYVHSDLSARARESLFNVAISAANPAPSSVGAASVVLDTAPLGGGVFRVSTAPEQGLVGVVSLTFHASGWMRYLDLIEPDADGEPQVSEPAHSIVITLESTRTESSDSALREAHGAWLQQLDAAAEHLGVPFQFTVDDDPLIPALGALGPLGTLRAWPRLYLVTDDPEDVIPTEGMNQ